MKANQQGSLLDATVWNVWFSLSVLGTLVNIGAGLMLELGYVSAMVEPIKTLPMEYGVVLPWLIIYAIGYLFTAAHNLNNKVALTTDERAVYAVIGIASSVGAVVLFLNPDLSTLAIVLLTVLGVAQCVTTLLRRS
jgi:hypothetical protein